MENPPSHLTSAGRQAKALPKPHWMLPPDYAFDAARYWSDEMAQTPEGKVKKVVKAAVLDVVARLPKDRTVYTFWPVQHGFGAATLDMIGAINGRAFAVETKAPGKAPTPRQELTIDEMRRAGVAVFVIDGEDGVADLRIWLESQS